MSRRVAALHKPPLLGYHVINKRGGGAVATPWYLAGGVSAANCVAAYQPIGAASYAASYSNLINPGTYDASPGNAPDWDGTNGWKFNGTDDFLDTGIVPANGYSAICRFSNASQADTTQVLFGIAKSVSLRWNFQPVRASDKHFYSYSDGTLEPAGALSSGVVALCPGKGYLDGVLENTFSYSWTNQTHTIYIGGDNNDTGKPTQYCNAYMQALAIYSIDISDYVAALTTAMNALTSESKTESLEGLLSFEPEEEKLWWQGADVDVLAQAQPQITQTWWDKANKIAEEAIAKAKKWIVDTWHKIGKAIEDYFDYHEED